MSAPLLYGVIGGRDAHADLRLTGIQRLTRFWAWTRLAADPPSYRAAADGCGAGEDGESIAPASGAHSVGDRDPRRLARALDGVQGASVCDAGEAWAAHQDQAAGVCLPLAEHRSRAVGAQGEMG